jgi:hypothetical protein
MDMQSKRSRGSVFRAMSTDDLGREQINQRAVRGVEVGLGVWVY